MGFEKSLTFEFRYRLQNDKLFHNESEKLKLTEFFMPISLTLCGRQVTSPDL